MPPRRRPRLQSRTRQPSPAPASALESSLPEPACTPACHPLFSLNTAEASAPSRPEIAPRSPAPLRDPESTACCISRPAAPQHRRCPSRTRNGSSPCTPSRSIRRTAPAACISPAAAATPPSPSDPAFPNVRWIVRRSPAAPAPPRHARSSRLACPESAAHSLH